MFTMAAKNKPDKPAPHPSVMTVMELSEYLRVHRTTIYRLLETGKIPHFRIGSDYRFQRDAIDEWCQTGGYAGRLLQKTCTAKRQKKKVR